jgi:4a-hydroxytetrahydrobiopterin dehydratase
VLSAETPAWERDGNPTLRREFSFPNFRDAFSLVVRVALLAESEGHHPEIERGWGRAAFSLTTHAASGLTQRLHHGRPDRPTGARLTRRRHVECRQRE